MRWSQKEIELLKQHYPSGGYKAVKPILNRCYSSIAKKADELNLVTRGRQRKKETLCWKCANCYGDCSWSEDFIPVDGWDAAPFVHKYYIAQNGSYVTYTSYSVFACPLFKRDT